MNNRKNDSEVCCAEDTTCKSKYVEESQANNLKQIQREVTDDIDISEILKVSKKNLDGIRQKFKSNELHDKIEHNCFSEADRIIRGKRGIQSVLYREWNWSVMMI